MEHGAALEEPVGVAPGGYFGAERAKPHEFRRGEDQVADERRGSLSAAASGGKDAGAGVANDLDERGKVAVDGIDRCEVELPRGLERGIR